MEESGTVTETTPSSDSEKAPRTFGGLTPAEASRRRWEKARERDAKGEGSARHVNARTPLDALRDLMSHDPDAYAEGLSKLVKAGDPRSITIMRELFATKGSVAIPRAEATIRAMSAEERRALLLELEARGATLPHEEMPPGVHSSDADATRGVEEG